MLCIFIYANLFSLSLKIFPLFKTSDDTNSSLFQVRRVVLQMLINSPYVHFSRTTVELEVNWATDGLFLNFQGGSFTFRLKTSHSRSEFAVSSNSSQSWQRSRAFLKFTSVQGEPVGGSWELGSNVGPPGHRMVCYFSNLTARELRGSIHQSLKEYEQLVSKNYTHK